MTSDRRWAVFALAGVAVGLLVATGVASLLVASTWRPSAGGGGDGQGAARAVDLIGSVGVLLAVLAGTVLIRLRPSLGGRWVVASSVAAPIVAFGGQLLAPRSRWDQLALRSVPPGEGIDGFWTAAFDDAVLFVLVDGREVGQEAYRNTAVVATAAPWVAASFLGLAAALVLRAPAAAG